MTEILGGSYKEVKDSHPPSPHNYHAHHVIAQNSSNGVLGIDKQEGAAIRMTQKDHLKTSSNDHGDDGKAWRAKQKGLLEKGNIGEAWNNEVADIRKHCGTKYDPHINQAEKHMLKLHQEGKIKLDDKFKGELEQRQKDYAKQSTSGQSSPSNQPAKKEVNSNKQSTSGQSYPSTQPAKKEVFSNNPKPFEQQKNTGKSR